MTEISFQGQCAIVTGAGRGLGRAYAQELARRGAAVMVNDVGLDDEDKFASRADSVVAEIRAAGGTAAPSTHDISTPEGGRALVDQTLEQFGAVHVLVNNAGFLRPAEFSDLSITDVRDVIGVHLLGAFHVTLPAWRAMREQRYGRVVMTGSSSAFGHYGNSNYAAAKAGIFGLTQSLALEGHESGIKVNCVFPFSETRIATDNPLVGRMHTRLTAALAGLHGRRPPMSVAHLVTYLASRESAVSGCAYSAMAGRYARVFLGVSHGWLSPDVSAVTAEEIGRHFEEINSTARFTVPGMLAEEIESVVERIKAQGPG
jgi:NAD(P)-dependent dehydrogenase (short-subunit alcohol dehydrogenase family)